MSSEQSPALPLRIGSRRYMALAWIGAGVMAAAVGLGADVAGLGIIFLAVPAAIGIAAILLGIVQLRRPTTLTIDDEGLSFTWLGRTRRWRWTEIKGFRIARVRSGRAIVFDVDRAGKTTVAAIPGIFETDTTTVVALLREAWDCHHTGRIGRGGTRPPA